MSHPFKVDSYSRSKGQTWCDCYQLESDDDTTPFMVTDDELLKHLEADENGLIVYPISEDRDGLVTLDQWLDFEYKGAYSELAVIINKGLNQPA